MAIVFPASPSVNDTFTAGSITYKWDGDKWIGLGVTPADRLIEGSNSLEITAGNDLVWTGDNIGIGISNPSVPLHISGTNGILLDDSTNQKRAELRSKNDVVELNAYDPANTNAPVPIVFKQYTSERLRISGDGQVLIGTDIQNSFNGVGQAHNLIVAGSTSDTDITDNSRAAITISNKDGTANNTAGLHFAREDTDGNPHYSGASIVAQFKETQVTGEYPKADLVFLTSIAANNAPSEKMRVHASGMLYHTGGSQNGVGGGNMSDGYYYRINSTNTVPASTAYTYVIRGLASGWMTIRGGGYSNAGQSQFAVCYQLGGYMTATSSYDVVTVQQWGNGVTISTTKNASDFRITLTNNSGTYGLNANWTIESSNGGLSIERI